ncbi:MAG TPA: vitamin B12 dependent-methionine synthase activation domain-containing protein, partial [Rudaea sp.]|nr:vitamin B12 dependent-methionine synthase activation domain-containing protein [Rudaea sp.]
VKDASRAVGVAQSLISKELVDDFLAKVSAEYADIRERHKDRGPTKRLVTLEHARGQAFAGNWETYAPPAPNNPGITVLDDYPLAELIERIDWTPFFNTWELSGHYPQIFHDAVVGKQARELFDDAQKMLKSIVAERWLTARGVIGLWPAHRIGDDVVIFPSPASAGEGASPARAAHTPAMVESPIARAGGADGGKSGTQPSELPPPQPSPASGGGSQPTTLHFLRQQVDKPPGRPDFCLADFVAPKDSGVKDWIGAFAVTAGLGIERKLEEFERTHDDYSSILLKALADRLAEAFAERLHERARKEFWGYAWDEALGNEDLVAEKYRGIRPAPGYPACPDHTEKSTLFALLDATKNAGIELTESFAMYPASAVSGWYFSHPESQYFVVGRITKQQVEDYARRKGWTLAEAERWLAPSLDYDPE